MVLGNSIEVEKSLPKAKRLQSYISIIREIALHGLWTFKCCWNLIWYSSYIYKSFNLLQNRESTSTHFVFLPIWLWIFIVRYVLENVYHCLCLRICVLCIFEVWLFNNRHVWRCMYLCVVVYQYAYLYVCMCVSVFVCVCVHVLTLVFMSLKC